MESMAASKPQRKFIQSFIKDKKQDHCQSLKLKII